MVVGPGVVDVVAVVGAGVTTAKARKTIYILDGMRKRQHFKLPRQNAKTFFHMLSTVRSVFFLPIVIAYLRK